MSNALKRRYSTIRMPRPLRFPGSVGVARWRGGGPNYPKMFIFQQMPISYTLYRIAIPSEIDLKALRQFMIVADCGSISRAAARLRISQPTLSRAIKNLEMQQGVPLFDRHGEGVDLTKYGKIFYAHTQEILNQYERAGEEIARLKGRSKRSLRIAAGDLWGYFYLPSIVRRFLISQPNFLIDMEIVDHAKRLDGLRNGTYDVVFGIIDPAIESFFSLNFLKMTAEGFSIYGDRNHPLAGRQGVDDEDLLKYSWVNHKFEFGIYEDSLINRSRDYTLKVNTLLNTVQAIQGTELLISASSGLEPLFETFELTKICTDTTRPVLPSGAIHWESLHEKPDLQKFVTLALEHFQSAPQ